MRNFITAISVIAIVFGALAFIFWGAGTEFGKRTGVYIDQDVKSERIIDSTYTVSTYVWYNPNWIKHLNGSIEWSAYVNHVKCYDVSKVKAEQYQSAMAAKEKIKSFIKSVNGTVCEP